MSEYRKDMSDREFVEYALALDTPWPVTAHEGFERLRLALDKNERLREALERVRDAADFDSQSRDGSWSVNRLDEIWEIANKVVARREPSAVEPGEEA